MKAFEETKAVEVFLECEVVRVPQRKIDNWAKQDQFPAISRVTALAIELQYVDGRFGHSV